jgi:pilus assembly protein FimV
MYISCEQCSTIFRLDERLLKPTGSKVRCSQCGNVFVEYPPDGEKEKVALSGAVSVQAAPEQPSEAHFDQELEGIDIDELDSIFEQGEMDTSAQVDDTAQLAVDPGHNVAAELYDDDLEMDFNLALEPETDQAGDAVEVVTEADSDDPDFDLEMDFDLDMDLEIAADENVEDNTAVAPVDDRTDDLDDPDLDLEMDFDLDTDLEIAADENVEDNTAVAPVDDSTDDLDIDLDFELEDMDFELETDDAVEEATDLDFDLEDMDFELETDDAVEEATDLDFELEDMDFELETDDAVEEATDLDFELEDMDSELETDDAVEEATVDPVMPAEEDTDLNGFNLDFEEALSETEQATEESTLSLEDDDEMLLDIDTDIDAPVTVADKEKDDFNLAELDGLLGGDASGRVSAGKKRESIDEDAELSLDDMPGQTADTSLSASAEELAATEDPDGLDLSDLDAMLDGVDGQTDQDEAMADLPELELEASSDDDNALEDLDFELDTEFEDKPIARADDSPAEESLLEDEEIDMSDIEQMLEGDDEALDTQQLEADFLGLGSDGGEKWAKGEAPELDLDDTDEIDLDEIEAAIDIADSEPADDTIRMGEIDDEELSLEASSLEESPSMDDGEKIELEDDLVLELEGDDDVTEAVELQEDDELDLSDLDMGEDQDSLDRGGVIDAGDMELEFQIEEDEPAPESRPNQSFRADTQEAKENFSIEDTVPAPLSAETEVESAYKPHKPKKSSSKGLLFLFLLVLLGGAGYLYYAVTYQGLDIPYVGQYLNPKPKDPAGIFKLTTVDINSKFVETKSGSRLFVIEGKVRNDYSVARQMIRLQGKLFTKGKVLAKSEFAYAGVSISDQDLSTQPEADIKKRLNSGISQGGATKVTPGNSLPFMVVFSELPEELDEFAIEVISSMPVK